MVESLPTVSVGPGSQRPAQMQIFIISIFTSPASPQPQPSPSSPSSFLPRALRLSKGHRRAQDLSKSPPGHLSLKLIASPVPSSHANTGLAFTLPLLKNATARNPQIPQKMPPFTKPQKSTNPRLLNGSTAPTR